MKKFIIVFLLLLCTNFFSFLPLRAMMNLPILLQVVSVLVFIYVFDQIWKTKNWYVGKGVRLIMFSMLMGIISAYVLYHQSFYDSIKAVFTPMMGFMLYFVFIKMEIEESFLIKTLIILSVIYTFLEMIQQVTYPVYWFNGREENEITGLLEQRMGLWRFYIFGVNYCMLAFLIVYQRVLNKIDLQRNLLLMIILFLGVVFFCARKNIYGVVSCIGLGLVFSRYKSSVGMKLLVCIFLLLIVYILPSYMADLNIQTSDELSDSDFIRFGAADYFINHFNHSNWYVVFGAGMPGGGSILDQQITYLREELRIFEVDCGIVGYYSRFGLFGVFAILYTIYLVFKNYKYVDLSLLLFLILEIEICFFDFFGNDVRNTAAFAAYLYLVECSIRRNKEELQALEA